MWSRVLALSLLLSLSASAQRGGRIGPGNTNAPQLLMVRITNEHDHPISFAVRVQLITSAGVPISENFAHDGNAQFTIQPGNYHLHVSGAEIEDTTTDTFTVFASEGAPMQFVKVKMRPQAGQVGSTQGTVSAGELNVPDKAKAELRKGNEEMAHQQWKKAIAHLEKAIDIYPQYATAYNDLGVASVKAGDKERARQAFQKAVELNEHSGAAYLNLARFALMDKDYPETIKLTNRSLALNPNQPEALVMLADAEIATGQFAPALLHARKVHEFPHEHFAVAHIIAATALEAQQKPAEAAAEYEMFLKEDPKSPRAPAVRQALSRLQAQAQPAAAVPKP